ncbi:MULTISPECIES: amidohydrolase family protein [Cohnella]|uniref:amidohydrolase family protein n=1 Tax=Cohnella TaxID=329857 RepID=UPI0009BB159C|nr:MULTISPECIES: amidohydrolase family protein [Cohnella]MBN2983516.1 amidohydrolase [Cohnella algarum]
MAVTSTEGVPEQKRSKPMPFPVIDTDVHERFASVEELLPYMKEPFLSYMKHWTGWGELKYTHPIGGSRLDSLLPNGNVPGSDYDVLREQLLDEYDIQYAILTGLFYPATMEAQFELAGALAAAYNEWVVDNWLGKDDRFLGSIHVAPQIPELAVREIEKWGDHPKMVQVLLPIGNVALGDPYYHAIYEAAQRKNLVIGMHQGNSVTSCFGQPRYYVEWHTLLSQAFMATAVNLILNGVFDKYPGTRVAMIEGGFSWVPSLMWRMDHNYKSLRVEVPWVKRLPSEYIKDHFRFATQPIEDPNPQFMLRMVEMMESDELLMFSTDYPHWDFDSPLRSLPTTFSNELKRKIFYDNAKNFYKLPDRPNAAR